MNENQTIRLAEIPIGGTGGAVWNRLHGEREDLCETLLSRQAHPQQQLMQARMRSIDDALDRLMANAYGICSNCGRTIEGAVLDLDPARTLCESCTERASTSNEQKLVDQGKPLECKSANSRFLEKVFSHERRNGAA